MFRHYRCVITIILFVMMHPVSSQHITEYPFPKLPLSDVSSGIIGGNNGFIVHGINSYSWYSEFFEWSGSMYIPYYLQWNGKQLSSPIFLPDTMVDNFYSLHGISERWKLSTILDNNNNPYVMWSTVKNQFSDVGPFFSLGSPVRSYARFNQGALQQLFVNSMSLNPSIVLDEHNLLQCVWESFKTEIVDPNDRYFSKFSSEIQYKIIGLDGSHYADLPEIIGKGFYPEIKIRNEKPYILFFAADSSSSQYFSIQVNQGQSVLFSKVIYSDTADQSFSRYTPIMVQQPLLQSFSWDVDSAEGVHAAWYHNEINSRKIQLLHTRKGNSTLTDTTIKLTPANGKIHTRYMRNGETRLLLLTTDGTLLNFSSVYGFPAVVKKTIPLNSTNSLLQSYFTDRKKNEHALVENVNGVTGLYLVKDLQTDSTKIILLSKEYSGGASLFVDSNNTVWLTGRRDSTNVLLSFNLNDIDMYPDFVFPLRVGNEWQYSVYGEPPALSPITTDYQKMVSDTIMPNGLRYIVLTSKLLPQRYFRKEGLKVFQYVPLDTMEYLRFDFSRSEGDTITRNVHEPYRSIVLQNIQSFSPFGGHLRSYSFIGSVDPSGQDLIVRISDSVGITFSAAVGPTWVLFGAKVNGKIFGQILSVEESDEQIPASFALSQNYPNPFNPSTTFEYQIPHRSFVSLKIYDAIGREVAMLVNEEKSAGIFKTVWNAERLSTGMYFVRMTAGSFATSKKLLFLK